MNIDIRAQVLCTDGLAGRCTRVIVKPAALRVTRLAIQDSEDPAIERLVPLDRVSGAHPGEIKLDCTTRELSQMDEFVGLGYIRVDVPDYRDAVSPLLFGDEIRQETVTVLREEENIAPDETAIGSNTRVEATDGWVGQVYGLEVERGSGRITWLVMRTGHIWEQKGAAIPAAQIDHIEDGAAYLKLDRQGVETLPVVLFGK